MSGWRDARAGLIAVVSAIPANLAFGIVTGVAILDAGLTGVEGVMMSALWFAGAAQLAALDLLQAIAPSRWSSSPRSS